MEPTSKSGPLLPPVVHRARLHRLLDGVATPGIIAISAQAAQGKTTLVADYLETRGVRSCWMALGPADADPAYFSQHLAKTLGRPDEAFSDDVSQSAADGRIAGLLNRLSPDIHLVFDGWHRIASTELTVRHINAIMTARPVKGCIYLLSREDLPIALQRDRMRRQALVLADQDLAFSEDEIGEFFITTSGLALDAGCKAQIHRLTAGWVGGLVILAEEFQRHPGDPGTMLAAPTMPERLQAEAGRYFMEEIYRELPESIQAFLLRAALLEEAPSALMQTLLGRGQADQLATEAVRRHLFVQFSPVASEQWALRMNPLFSAFLERQARDTLLNEDMQRLMLDAARHYHQTQVDIEAAAGFYLKADAYTEAARAITTIGMELLIEGRFDEITPWTAQLPASFARNDPWLGLLQATTFRISGGHRTIAELQNARQAFARSKHLRGQMLCLAYQIETGVFSGYAPDALAAWITEGQRLLVKTQTLAHYNFAKALLWQMIGLGTLADMGGDLEKGLSACESAIVLGKRMGNHPLVANTLIIAAQAHVQSGEFDQARKRLQAALALYDGDRFPEYGALRNLVEFHLALIDAQTDAAAVKLDQVQTVMDKLGLIRLYPSYLEACGLMQLHRKTYTALEKTNRHLHDVAILLNNPVYRAIGYWIAGLGCYHQERYRRAGALMRHAAAIPDLPLFQQARNWLLMGFITLNSAPIHEAETHLMQALSLFEERGLALYACEAQMGLALVKNAGADAKAAQALLEAAFSTAARRGYDHFHVIRPVDLARACALAIHLDTPAVVAHARHLLANRLDDAEIKNMASDESAGALAQSIDASATQHAIYRARIPVLVVRTLGGLQVLRNGTEPISARTWQGSRPALLLKAILVHGGRHIPKDILLEAVWPDHHPDKSLRNFKVTLHRLRKMLEPDLAPGQGSAYIHLKDNLVSLDKHRFQVDTDALHHLCKRARRMDTVLDTQELLDMHQEASALYQGDFLPEDPYLAWAEMKRTTLRQEFIQLMYRLGRHLQEQHEFSAARRCYRHIVQTDPGQEKAQRHLMRLLEVAGRSQEALQVYDRLQNFLQIEIGAAVERATVDLYHAIRKRLLAD